MKIRLLCLMLIVYCSVFIAFPVRADYVLPYPSYMPGNKMYRVSRMIDQLKRYWYFGNIAQIKYHMQLADKYLVEAKTLMEYRQYLLGSDALVRSDKEFMQLPKYVNKAKAMHIDITMYQQSVRDEGMKHVDALSLLDREVPGEFTWTPEKANATHLNLHDMLKQSIDLRTSLVSTITQL